MGFSVFSSHSVLGSKAKTPASVNNGFTYEVITSKIITFMQTADHKCRQYPFIQQAADVLNVRPLYVPLAGIALLLLLVGKMEDLILGIVGFFYPAWSSFKVIRHNDNNGVKKWLTYWVVYAAFSFVEIFSDLVLFWIPFYYILKVVFILWLSHPDYQGALFVYEKIVAPLLVTLEPQYDRVMDRMNETFSDASSTRRH